MAYLANFGFGCMCLSVIIGDAALGISVWGNQTARLLRLTSKLELFALALALFGIGIFFFAILLSLIAGIR